MVYGEKTLVREEDLRYLDMVNRSRNVGAKKDAIVGFVYQTENYGQFKKLDGNRELDPANLKRLEQSMMVKQLPIPGVVNEHLQTIDAQHRLYETEKLGLKFYYIVAPGLDIDDCVTANINSKRWTQLDVIKRYAIKDESYARILSIMEEFSVSLEIAFSATGTYVNLKYADREKFKAGVYHLSAEDYLMAKERIRKAFEICEIVERCKKSAGSKLTQRDKLIEAVIRCQKTVGYDHKRMLKMCEENGMDYVNVPKTVDVLRQLMTFYNKGKRRTTYMDVTGEGTSLKINFNSTVRR